MNYTLIAASSEVYVLRITSAKLLSLYPETVCIEMLKSCNELQNKIRNVIELQLSARLKTQIDQEAKELSKKIRTKENFPCANRNAQQRL